MNAEYRTDLAVGPAVFDFQNLHEFFSAVVASKRSRERSFSYARWARQLGVSNLATLTRILRGDRTPGERLAEVLERHFHFNAQESEYFRTLILIAQAKRDERLREALQEKLARLAHEHLQARVDSTTATLPASPLFQISGATVLQLHGSVDRQAADKLIEGLELQMLPGEDRPSCFLSVGRYERTTLGPYEECYLALVVTKPGSTLLEAGLLFLRTVTPSRSVATAGALIWRNKIELGSVGLSYQASAATATAALTGERPLQLYMDAPDIEPVSPHELEVDVFSNTRGPQSRSRIAFRGRSLSRLFDPARDRFDATASGSSLGSTLTGLSFEPVTWALYSDMQCEVSAPTAS